MNGLGHWLNGRLDRLVRPQLRLFRRLWPSYGVFVVSGIVLGILCALGLAVWRGLSALDMSLAVAAAFAASVLLALSSRRLLQKEVFTFYHYQIAALAAAGVGLGLAGRPALPHLDLLALSVAAAQAWVRIGCLMAGCCHGRPCRWGVRYRGEHVHIGFPPALVGVRLLPTQLLESLVLLALVASGLCVLAVGRPAGETMSICLVGYAAWRFGVEFARGDGERRLWRGFSEAQWTSVSLLAAGALAARSGALPLAGLWLTSALALVAWLGLVAVGRRLRSVPTHEMLHPERIHELAGLLRRLSAVEEDPALPVEPTEVELGITSWGLRISTGRVPHAVGTLRHYCLSSVCPRLSAAAAAAIGDLIVRLRHAGAASEVVAGAPGVYHLLVGPEPAGGEV